MAFDFAPNRMVVKNKAPTTSGKAMTMNGWTFTARPNIPYVRTFSVKLMGMTWYLLANGLYDETTNPYFNARRLEKFYEGVQLWDNFDFPHPHLGTLKCRFFAPLDIPEAVPNSGGFIDGFEITLIQHNPGF
jgi:hypothetical protein